MNGFSESEMNFELDGSMARRSGILFYLVASILTLTSSGQEYMVKTRHFSADDGLSSQVVNQITKDQRGFLWLATKNGLNRFDGHEFEQFFVDNSGLVSNNVAGILTDENGRLWVFNRYLGTSLGAMDTVLIFDPRIEEFTQYSEVIGSYPARGLSMIHNWMATSSGIFIGTDNGYLTWVKPDGTATVSKNDGLEYHVPVTWSANHGVYTFQSTYMDNGKVKSVFRISGSDTIQTQNAELGEVLDKGCLGVDIHGNLRYVNGNKSLFPDLDSDIVRYTETGVENEEVFLEDIFGYSGFDQSSVRFKHNPFNDETWMFYKDSLVIMDQRFRIKFRDAISKEPQLSSFIKSVYFENEADVWVATIRGFYQLKVRERRFNSYFTFDQTRQWPVSSNACRAIHALTDNDIILSTDDGIVRLGGESGSAAESVKYITDREYISLGFDFKDNHILYMDSGRLAKFDLHKGHREVISPQLTHPSEDAWAIRPLPNGVVLSGGGRVTRWDSKTGGIRYISTIPEGQKVGQNIYQIFQHQDQIWLSSATGLLVYNDSDSSIVTFSPNDTGKLHIPTAHVHSTLVDDQNIFWLATADNGLVKWNPETGEAKSFTYKQGLADNVVYGILEDERGFLWLSTDNGVSRLDPTTESIVSYGKDDGLFELEFNRGSFHKSNSGRFYFGSVNGLYYFNPADFWEDSAQNQIPLQVIGLSQDQSSQNRVVDLYESFLADREITLNPFDRFFTLKFQLLDYGENQTGYAYRIDGIDSDWNFISQNSLRISGLDGGNYKLRIKGQLATGSWSSEELSIPITVIDPLYKRPWFITICLMALVLGAMAFIRFRTAQLRARTLKLEQTVAERTAQLNSSLEELDVSLKQKEMLLKEIHHRVKNNLQIISSFIELESMGVKDESIKEILKQGRNRVKAMALIHKNLYQKDDLGHIDMKTYLEELIGAISSGFIGSSDRIKVKIESEDISLDIDTAIPVGLILTELVTNSFKYAFADKEEGAINIKLSGTDSKYELVVTDSGPGFPTQEDEKQGSLGLRLVTMLTEQIDGEVNLSNNNGAVASIIFKGVETRRLED